MYAYAGIAVDRDAGCRGGCITGATGSGKTLACIIPRLHSLCINESGIERPEWAGSRAQRDFENLRRGHRSLSRDVHNLIARLCEARGQAEKRHNRLRVGLSGQADAEPEGVRLLDGEIGRARGQCDRADRELQVAADAVRRMRYRVPPWGGFVCGEKGNEWQTIEALLRHHGREEDLCLLRTRPSWAPPGWSPSVRFNLISMDEVPADTCAKMIVDTGLAVEEAGTRDEFFVPQARDKIAWGIRLVRAVKAAAPPSPGGAGQGLLTLFDMLTVQESYRRYLVRCLAEHPQPVGIARIRRGALPAREQLLEPAAGPARGRPQHPLQLPCPVRGARNRRGVLRGQHIRPAGHPAGQGRLPCHSAEIRRPAAVRRDAPQDAWSTRSSSSDSTAAETIRTGSTGTSSSWSRTNGRGTPSARTARRTSCARPAGPSTRPPSPRTPSGSS